MRALLGVTLRLGRSLGAYGLLFRLSNDRHRFSFNGFTFGHEVMVPQA